MASPDTTGNRRHTAVVGGKADIQSARRKWPSLTCAPTRTATSRTCPMVEFIGGKLHKDSSHFLICTRIVFERPALQLTV